MPLKNIRRSPKFYYMLKIILIIKKREVIVMQQADYIYLPPNISKVGIQQITFS